MTPIHLAAAIARLPHVLSPKPHNSQASKQSRNSPSNKAARSLQDAEVSTFADALLEEFIDKIEHQQAWGLASCIWALGKIGYTDRYDLIAQVLNSTIKKSADFLPQGVSMTLYGLQALASHGPKVVLPNQITDVVAALAAQARALASETPQQSGKPGQLASFEPQHVANTIWSIARLHKLYTEWNLESPVSPAKHSIAHLYSVLSIGYLHQLQRFSP